MFPNFSVEMETGTGKTYVYLRTIFALNKLYGFKKFIIVVPSVAIREGVTSSIKLMREHFKGLYDNVAFDNFVYADCQTD
jgi:type III restriction enzyme